MYLHACTYVHKLGIASRFLHWDVRAVDFGADLEIGISLPRLTFDQ